jgi:hypothetical protein
VGGFTYRTIFKLIFARMLHPRAKIKVVALYPKPEFRPGLLWRLVAFTLYSSSETLLDWGRAHEMDVTDTPVCGFDFEEFLSGLPLGGTPELPTGRPLQLLHVGHVKSSRGLDEYAKLARVGQVRLSMLASKSEPTDPEVLAMLRNADVDVTQEFVTDLSAFYAQHDLYVFPVRNPHGAISTPLSIIEALLSGLPVVSTPFGDVPKFFGAHPKVKIVASLTDLSIEDMCDLAVTKTAPIMQDDLLKFDTAVIARKLL